MNNFQDFHVISLYNTVNLNMDNDVHQNATQNKFFDMFLLPRHSKIETRLK